jgi:hypothetical protein
MTAWENDVLIDCWAPYTYMLSRGTALGEVVSIPRGGWDLAVTSGEARPIPIHYRANSGERSD